MIAVRPQHVAEKLRSHKLLPSKQNTYDITLMTPTVLRTRLERFKKSVLVVKYIQRFEVALKSKFRNYGSLCSGSKVLLEKLIVPQQVQKFPPFYRAPRFITVLTTARLMSLS